MILLYKRKLSVIVANTGHTMYCWVLPLFSALFLGSHGLPPSPSLEERCENHLTRMFECNNAVREEANFMKEVHVNVLDSSIELNVSYTIVDSFCGFISKHVECIRSNYAQLEQCPVGFTFDADAVLHFYEGVCTTFKSDFKGLIPCVNNNKVVLSEIYQCFKNYVQEVKSSVDKSDESFLTFDTQCRIMQGVVPCFDKLRYCCEAGGEHGRRVLEFLKTYSSDICVVLLSNMV